jgi:hypothetical protein
MRPFGITAETAAGRSRGTRPERPALQTAVPAIEPSPRPPAIRPRLGDSPAAEDPTSPPAAERTIRRATERPVPPADWPGESPSVPEKPPGQTAQPSLRVGATPAPVQARPATSDRSRTPPEGSDPEPAGRQALSPPGQGQPQADPRQAAEPEAGAPVSTDQALARRQAMRPFGITAETAAGRSRGTRPERPALQTAVPAIEPSSRLPAIRPRLGDSPAADDVAQPAALGVDAPSLEIHPQVRPYREPAELIPTEVRLTRRDPTLGTATIRVSIGRIEVRAVTAPAPAPPHQRPPRPRPTLSLDDYLKGRKEGWR